MHVFVDGQKFISEAELFSRVNAWQTRALEAERKLSEVRSNNHALFEQGEDDGLRIAKLESDIMELNEELNERRTCGELEAERDAFLQERNDAMATADDLQQDLDAALLVNEELEEVKGELVQSVATLVTALAEKQAELERLRCQPREESEVERLAQRYVEESVKKKYTAWSETFLDLKQAVRGS